MSKTEQDIIASCSLYSDSVRRIAVCLISLYAPVSQHIHRYSISLFLISISQPRVGGQSKCIWLFKQVTATCAGFHMGLTAENLLYLIKQS